MTRNLLNLTTSLCALGGAAVFAPQAVHAQAQQVIEFDVCTSLGCNDNTVNGTYFGPGEDSQLTGNSSAIGGVSEASATDDLSGANTASDTYDGYGALYGVPDGEEPDDSGYALVFNGLTSQRQTETYATVTALPNNSIRWVDSFTNNTAAPVDFRLAFGGNLGSDSDTETVSSGATYVVTGDSGDGNDPIIAHIYGNNAFAEGATVQVENSFYITHQEVTVAPGETITFLHANILYYSVDRTENRDAAYLADAALAASGAEFFINSPVFAGMSASQIATLINWNMTATETLDEDGGGFNVGSAQISQALIGNFLFSPPTFEQAPDQVNFLPQNFSDVNTRVYALAGGAAGDISGSDFDANYFGLGASVFMGDMSFGAALTQSNANSGSAIDANSSGTALTLYGQTETAGLTLRAALSYGAFDQSYSRTAGAATARGDTDVDAMSLGLYAGYTIAATGIAEITPYAAVTVTRTDTDGYTETGAGLANLTVGDFSETGTTYEIGVRASQQMNEATLYGGIGYAYRDGDGADVATSFGAGAPTTSRLTGFSDGSQFVLEAGITAPLGGTLGGKAAYKGYIGDDDVHTLDVGLEYRF